MHVYSDLQCMQAQMANPMGYRGSIYRDKMYVQRTNHMGLWGHNPCTKEQSYRDMRYLCVQRTNPMGIGCTNRGPIYPMSTRCTYSHPFLWDAACSYTYLCTCESSMSGTKNNLYGKQRGVVIRNASATMQGKTKRMVQKLST